ncbi:Gfo/Idh/MocA family oxidoreductase [Klebsiella pneumoniae]|uniref:Gfo/Idh/MocA family oxidoreductase n=1 Tax=Klebsiella pneumoniae TaxID=573 RepID=UPI003EC03948
MSDAIRVGLVGFGYASKTFHAPLIGGTPGMALKAVASSDADKVHADWPGVKVMSAPGDLLDDPDIESGGHRHPERHPLSAGESGAGGGKACCGG